VACPYFVPEERCELELWPHRSRLPLGDGFTGICQAPGFEGTRPAAEELKDGCNVGYACGCPRLPKDRVADAVRFAVARDDGEWVTLHFACERDHLPAGHGTLEFSRKGGECRTDGADRRMVAQARQYLAAYLARNPGR